MTPPRALATVVAVSVALVVQVSVLSHWTVRGVGPDLVLLVVVAGGLVHGAETGMVLGFGSGLLLDLAPPSDHLAGRWALALLLVGWLAGQLAGQLEGQLADGRSRPRLPQILVVAGAASFVGTSTFALSGLVLGDLPVEVGRLLEASAVSLVWDVALALVVVPLTVALFDRVEPDRVLA